MLICQIRCFADTTHFQVSPKPCLADARIPDSGFNARIRTNQQQGVSILYASQCAIQDITFAHPICAILRPGGTTICILHTEPSEKIKRCLGLLNLDQVSGDNADFFRGCRQRLFHGRKSLAPISRAQFAVLANVRLVEALAG